MANGPINTTLNKCGMYEDQDRDGTCKPLELSDGFDNVGNDKVDEVPADPPKPTFKWCNPLLMRRRAR